MFLVDTHIPLWLASGDRRLGERTRAQFASGTEASVSSVSVVEWTIKIMRGRLRVEGGPLRLIEPLGFRSLAFTAEHARHMDAFTELVAHDPFDRMLVAQAESEGLRFLTADRFLLGLGKPWIIDARE